jgi:hypothetical protein
MELSMLSGCLADPAYVAIDDGNYNYLRENTAYLNMIRKKFNLPPVAIARNEGAAFWERTEQFLKRKFTRVVHLKDTYKETFQNDLFWSYYNNDRRIMADMQMEKTDSLIHRFDTWRVSGRKQGAA